MKAVRADLHDRHGNAIGAWQFVLKRCIQIGDIQHLDSAVQLCRKIHAHALSAEIQGMLWDRNTFTWDVCVHMWPEVLCEFVLGVIVPILRVHCNKYPAKLYGYVVSYDAYIHS